MQTASDNYPPELAFPSGMTSVAELRQLTAWAAEVAELKGARVEIGVFRGRSAMAIALGSQGQKITLVDTWAHPLDEGEYTGRRPRRGQNIDPIQQLADCQRQLAEKCPDGNFECVRMRSHTWLRCVCDEPIVFAHVDGSHDYDQVRCELSLIADKLGPSWLVCGHDWRTASAEKTHLGGGVERAVWEFAEAMGRPLEIANNQWVIRS